MAKAGRVYHWKHGWIPLDGTGGASAAKPKVLHRGVSVAFSDDELRRISDLLQPPEDESQIDQEFQIGDMVIAKLLAYQNPNNEKAGIGNHWTARPDFAQTAARVGDGLPVVLTAEWQGDGEDLNRTGTGAVGPGGKPIPGAWASEQETTLNNSATLKITSIKVRDMQSWTEVLKEPVTVRGAKRVKA